MAFPTLSPHNFAAASNMEAALGAFMGFDFWHPKLPLPFPYLVFRVASDDKIITILLPSIDGCFSEEDTSFSDSS